MEKVYKVLTRNDTGETHSHQSGITIPKKVAETTIFPKLGIDKLNPRTELLFFDEEGKMWCFQYIYYNDVFHGKERSKAHNEHRLTCVKDYIRANNIKSGDSIWFGIDLHGVRKIGFVSNSEDKNEGTTVIKLGYGWKYINI